MNSNFFFTPPSKARPKPILFACLFMFEMLLSLVLRTVFNFVKSHISQHFSCRWEMREKNVIKQIYCKPAKLHKNCFLSSSSSEDQCLQNMQFIRQRSSKGEKQRKIILPDMIACWIIKVECAILDFNNWLPIIYLQSCASIYLKEVSQLISKQYSKVG